jgi:PAS domain S-box-containing protein
VGLIITQDGRFKYANQAASEILEYPIEEMLNWDAREGYIKIVHPVDRALVMEQERRKDIGGNDVVVHYAWKALTKRGRTKCVETYWKPISFQGKGANLMTMIDITERDRAEKAFKRSEKLYRELVASVSSIVWECDANTIEFSFVSKEAERLLGYPVRRWIKEPGFWQGHIHEDDRQWTIDYCTKATAEKRDHELEYRMIAADGRTVWLRDIVHVVVENNEPVKLRGIMTDISERKLVEEEIVNLAKFPAEDPDPVLRVLTDCTIVYRNEASKTLLEFWRCLQDAPIPDSARECIKKALNTGKVVHDEVLCCDKVYSLRYAPVTEAGYVNIYANDITERRQAEEALTESQESLAHAQRITHIGNWDWNVDQDNLLWSDEMFRIFGLDRAEFTANYNDFINIVHPEDREFVNEQVQSALEGRAPFDCQFRLLLKDGTLKDIEAKGKIFRDENGKPMRMIGTNQDITERKQAEEAIKEIQERFSDFFRNAPIGFHIFCSDRVIIDINDAELAMIGYTRDEIVGKKTWADLIIPEQRKQFEEHWNSIITKGEVENLEYTLVHKQGHLVDVLLSASSRFDEDGCLINTRGSVLNITERKQAEEALRDSEMKSRALLEGSPVCNKIIDLDSRLLYMSAAGIKCLKIPDIKPYYGTVYPLQFYPESAQGPLIEHLERAKAGETSSVEAPALDMEGREVWFHTTFVPACDDQGRIEYIIASSVNITERKRADELIRVSEANYRAIFESANDAIFIHDIEKGEILDFNPKMSEIFGYTRAEAKDFTVDDLSSGKPGYTQKDALEWIRKASDGTPQVFEWQCRHKSGRLFRAEVSLKRARISGQDRMLAIVRDITDRKA